ncbi:MAG: hypothetical protein LBJ41_01755 [Treponema sp.]|jgi:hypothetical protein|nr:hypothetical protein [Treponema sp.]
MGSNYSADTDIWLNELKDRSLEFASQFKPGNKYYDDLDQVLAIEYTLLDIMSLLSDGNCCSSTGGVCAKCPEYIKRNRE